MAQQKQKGAQKAPSKVQKAPAKGQKAPPKGQKAQDDEKEKAAELKPPYTFIFTKAKASLNEQRNGGTTVYFVAAENPSAQIHVHLKKGKPWDTFINFEDTSKKPRVYRDASKNDMKNAKAVKEKCNAIKKELK
mmetsp:Transcript_23768/g.37764  ORF Transcript_23768/g.37764 Transcript_23768/m.37764 type:complete len:134 (-) Transcript_23768:135-536(-)